MVEEGKVKVEKEKKENKRERNEDQKGMVQDKKEGQEFTKVKKEEKVKIKVEA